MRAFILAGAAAALLGACASTTDMASDEFVFPEGLKVMEGGYPYYKDRTADRSKRRCCAL